jgi:phosphoribosylformylglycinamidine (FGAM) synthase-like enzyme
MDGVGEAELISGISVGASTFNNCTGRPLVKS